MKPIFCCDFDGVIHSYTTENTPWDPTFIPDPPVLGAFDFLREMTKHARVMVYSSRSHQDGGIEAMQQWMRRWAIIGAEGGAPTLAWMEEIEWPTYKPSAKLTLDDRALLFTGTFPDPQVILTFKPWNKKD
jgi:hypothetical protein